MRRGKWLHRKGRGNGPGPQRSPGDLAVSWRLPVGDGAFHVAAGRVGGVAAVVCGGLVGAVGAVVGAHGLAQPAMVGTVRLFREPAATVSSICSLFAGRRGEGGGRGRAAPIHRIAADC